MACAAPLLARFTGGGPAPEPDPLQLDAEIVRRVLDCERVGFTTTQPQGERIVCLNYVVGRIGYQVCFEVDGPAWAKIVEMCRRYDMVGLRVRPPKTQVPVDLAIALVHGVAAGSALGGGSVLLLSGYQFPSLMCMVFGVASAFLAFRRLTA
jgi:hypothetical protein